MNIFTYGSLMFVPVWQHVVHGQYRSVPALLDGHARFAVLSQIYPGLVAQPGAAVQGVIYLDIDARDIAALDTFEGEAYRRVGVAVTLEDGTVAPADTYVFMDACGLSTAAWHPEAFELQRFLDTYCRDKRA